MPRPHGFRTGGSGDGRMFFEGQYDPGYMFNPEFDTKYSKRKATISSGAKIAIVLLLLLQFTVGLILHLLGLL